MRLPTPIPLRDAETDRVWVIVPLSRPERIPLVLENFVRQKFPFKKLVVVANGRALGHPQLSLLERAGTLLLTSEHHQSAAKNTALAEIRKRGGGFTVVMDDDDWYGSQYLTEACGYARSFDVIGKARHFVSIDDGLWLCSREQRDRQGSDWITGGTLACWAESAHEYPAVRYGEDVSFCLTAAQRGMSIRRTDIYHYLYCRRSAADHTWPESAEHMRRQESTRGALDLGLFDAQVIEGRLLDVDVTPLASHEDLDTLVPPAPARRTA